MTSRARSTCCPGRSTTCNPPWISIRFSLTVKLSSSSSKRVFGIRISYGRLRKTPSSEAFLRSMRQLLSLTMIRISHQRSFQTGFHQRQGNSQQFSGLAERNKVLGQRSVTKPLEAKSALTSSTFARWFQLFWFLSAPSTRDGLKGIGQDRLTDDAKLPQPHQKRRATHAVQPLQVNQFLVAKGVPLFPDLTKQVLPGHYEGPGKQSGRLLFILVAEAVGVNQAMSQFMGQGQAPALQGKLLVDDNHRQAGIVLAATNHAGEPGYTLR